MKTKYDAEERVWIYDKLRWRHFHIQTDYLHGHNFYRDKYGTLALEYSTTLADEY